MTPDLDGGTSQLGMTLPNELKTAVYETAHDRRETMSNIGREALMMWFEAQPAEELPGEAVENLEDLGVEFAERPERDVDVGPNGGASHDRV